MKSPVIIFAFIAAVGIMAYNIPALQIKKYQQEVDTLAQNYRLYSASVCPNRSILKSIREKYIAGIDKDNVSKLLWVNNNFDKQFMETCLEIDPHRGE